MSNATGTTTAPTVGSQVEKLDEMIVEIVSDSGEGAQKAGQALGAISAKMGNGVWTVEIIPAEIKPPARSKAGASGIRVRIGHGPVTNMGDEAGLVVALNEQVLYGRIEQDAYKAGTVVLLENKWKDDQQELIRRQYAEALADFRARGLVVHEVPLEEACLRLIPDPRVGKNMFVLGMLCRICGRSIDKAKEEIAFIFGRKGEQVVARNHQLLEAGWHFAEEQVPLRYEIEPEVAEGARIVTNGNQAIGLGVMASGIELVSMYPITPATSASHYLSGALPRIGGVVHQAEDEIAAIGFAIGASYAGKTACTITSGPGLALKTEFLGLAVMAEIPLVLVLVQRGGPSTGLPTKVEQGDLLSVLFGEPGDAPKIVLAASTIEECYHFPILARKLAEAFRGPVMVLTDTNLATGVSPFARPDVSGESFAPPLDQSPWDQNVPAFDWDDETGISPRPIPGQRGGEYVLTGLAHTQRSKVAYDPFSNQTGCERRSAKLRALQKTLRPPEVLGDKTGDLLVVGWGSTNGAIVEAVKRLQSEGHKVSHVHLRFLSPLEPGLPELFAGFKRVMTIEMNYSDPVEQAGDGEQRRRAQLATWLRAQTLCDIDCWSNVHGQPLRPGLIRSELKRRLDKIAAGAKEMN